MFQFLFSSCMFNKLIYSHPFIIKLTIFLFYIYFNVYYISYYHMKETTKLKNTNVCRYKKIFQSSAELDVEISVFVIITICTKFPDI